MRGNQVALKTPTVPGPFPEGRCRLLALALALAGLLIFSVTPAFAAKTHHFVKALTLGASGHGFGSFGGVGVDEATGNVFVGNFREGGYVVDIVGAEGGAPVGVASPFAVAVGAGNNFGAGGLAVDNSPTSPSKGDLYVVDSESNVVRKFALNPLSEEYELKGTLDATRPADVAVDAKGNVFIADAASKSVAKFDPAGNEVGQIPVGFFTKAVDLDAKGDLYVQEAPHGEGSPVRVFKFTANASGEIEPGTAPLEITSSTGNEKTAPTAIAVDRSSEELYVAFYDRHVEQFDSAGTRVGEFETDHFEVFSQIAVNGQSGGLYLLGPYVFPTGGTTPGVGIFGPTLIAPDATTGEASGETPTGAILNGVVSAAAGLPATCEFEYASEASFKSNGFAGAATAPCSPAGPFTGSGDEAVSATVGGLTTQTLYFFRLVASSENGSTRGKTLRFFTPGPPLIESETVTDLSSSQATLNALVNPASEAASYVFEYVSEADFNESGYAKATVVPVGGEAVGSGFEGVAVAQQVTGLSAGASYVFRTVATNPLGTTQGPDRLFTTVGLGGFPQLPDGRAYEQVTPMDKNGTAPTGGAGLVQAATDGNGITYAASNGIPGSEGAQQYPHYLAVRGSDWATQGFLPSATTSAAATVLGWSEDLSQAYVTAAPLPRSPGDFLQHDSATHELRTIAGEVSIKGFRYVGASADNTVVIFESEAPLLENAAKKATNAYAWDQASGALSLVGVLPNGLAPAQGSRVGAPGQPNQMLHLIASDGSRVFFSDAGTGQLYLRKNPLAQAEDCGVPGDACTVRVSAPQGVSDPKKPATFMSGAADGSAAFFTSAGKLTVEANTGPKGEGNDLYRYDAESGELVDLTPDAAAPAGAEVQGVLGTGADGSYAYFVANGALAPGATPGTCTGSNFGPRRYCNLYLWHDGITVLITRLAEGDAEDRANGAVEDPANWSLERNVEPENTARVSLDGQTLLFRSQVKLTAYDNEGAGELYRYSAPSDRLICVSCSPTGAAPIGSASLRSLHVATGNLSAASFMTRNLSADGERIFFETPDKLVASDTNGDDGCPARVSNQTKVGISRVRNCQDVYEWEAKGAGSCRSDAQDGGCLYLLSTGTSLEPSYFADASADGGDAFFFTVQGLVGQDKDQIVDIYDARVGGGLASQNPPPPPPTCEGEACKGPVPVVAPTESPGSASFSAPGNPKPSRHSKKRHHKKKHKKRHAARKHR